MPLSCAHVHLCLTQFCATYLPCRQASVVQGAFEKM